jgi:hypothetical protein
MCYFTEIDTHRFGPPNPVRTGEDQSRDQVKEYKEMGRAKCLFRETEVRRAVRAAEAGGKRVAKFEIDPTGKIIVVFDNGATDTAPMHNEWDEAAE